MADEERRVRVAIVGGGIAGAVAASTLSASTDALVTVFDQGLIGSKAEGKAILC